MLRNLIGRYRNVLYVICAAGIGATVPAFGAYLEPLVTPFVIFLVFSSLRGLDLSEIDASSYAFLFVLSLVMSYVVFPVGGVALVGFVLDGGGVLGFAIALSVPTTAGSAIIWTRLAGGDVQLATVISIGSLLVAPVVTPLVLTGLVGAELGVPIRSILVDLAIIVGGGTLLAVVVPSGTVSPKTVDHGATLAVLVLIYTSVAGVEASGITPGHLLSVVGLSVVLVVFGLVASLLCKRGFGLSRTRAIPLFFTGSLKNLGIALLIALPFTDPLVVFSVIVYYVVQQFSGAILADTIG